MNCDTSVGNAKGWLGYGALVRDDKGMVMAAQCKTLLGNLDPMLAEVGVVLMAIQLCKTLGFHSLHFEGDAQVVVEGVNSMERDWSRKGIMVEDIKHELKGFRQWRMSFVRREGNQATHALFKIATMAEVNQIWINKSPDCIQESILMEHHALSS